MLLFTNALGVDLAPGCASQDTDVCIARGLPWWTCQLPPCSKHQQSADQAIETGPIMSCLQIMGVERHPIASRQSTTRRQRIINTSCITGCFFGVVSAYQTSSPRSEAY
jgi:hypothetical protein